MKQLTKDMNEQHFGTMLTRQQMQQNTLNNYLEKIRLLILNQKTLLSVF